MSFLELCGAVSMQSIPTNTALPNCVMLFCVYKWGTQIMLILFLASCVSDQCSSWDPRLTLFPPTWTAFPLGVGGGFRCIFCTPMHCIICA